MYMLVFYYLARINTSLQNDDNKFRKGFWLRPFTGAVRGHNVDVVSAKVIRKTVYIY